MTQDAQKLKRLIEASQRILIITHTSPDADAFCSMILAGTAIQAGFPDKNVVMTSEELNGDFNFLEGYGEIDNRPLAAALNRHKPDLIIMVDAMNYGRTTADLAAVNGPLNELKPKLVIIDHHEPEGVEKCELYINSRSPAATQDVYKLLINDMSLPKPRNYAQTALLGIISDTSRFLYDNPKHRDTFSIASELIDAGASIEQLENKLSRYSVNDMHVFSELARNVTSTNDYNYSFISDEFAERWQNEGLSKKDLKLGCEIFVSGYIRNINGHDWGFIVYPELNSEDHNYAASFRAVSGTKDVSIIAKKLGGGGHKPAAGAKFSARSADEAVNRVKESIVEP